MLAGSQRPWVRLPSVSCCGQVQTRAPGLGTLCLTAFPACYHFPHTLSPGNNNKLPWRTSHRWRYATVTVRHCCHIGSHVHAASCGSHSRKQFAHIPPPPPPLPPSLLSDCVVFLFDVLRVAVFVIRDRFAKCRLVLKSLSMCNKVLFSLSLSLSLSLARARARNARCESAFVLISSLLTKRV